MNPAAHNSFDDLACEYDRYRIGYADEVYDALDQYGLGRGMRVLDVGCGTGLVSAALLKRRCSVVGLDSSAGMLVRARERVHGGTFVRGRAENLPFENATFDAAVSAQAFHWFDRTRALAELSRVLRPGAAVGIWWKALMRGDTTRLLREDIAHELGLSAPSDLLAQDFDEFDESALLDRRLRVIPWIVQTTVGDFLGYERSRKRALDAFGSARDTYLARLAERLGPAPTELVLRYVHLLYLGRVAPGDGVR